MIPTLHSVTFIIYPVSQLINYSINLSSQIFTSQVKYSVITACLWKRNTFLDYFKIVKELRKKNYLAQFVKMDNNDKIKLFLDGKYCQHRDKTMSKICFLGFIGVCLGKST